MKYEVFYTSQFKKSLKLCFRRGLNLKEFTTVLDILQEKGELPSKYRPHKLQGKYKGCWECHINPDWLLIYIKDTEIRIISLQRTGTHSDLFGKNRK